MGFLAVHCPPMTLAALLLALPLAASADCGKDPECDDPSAWARFTTIDLTVSSPDFPEVFRWNGRFDHEVLDIAIDVDAPKVKPPQKGTVALVGGRIMLTRGIAMESGSEIDALDAPVLNMKLAMILLGRVFPEGPSGISGQRRIDRTDKVGIKYATPSASGYIPAPWRLKGKVAKLAGERVAYDLALTFPADQPGRKRKTVTMKMNGEFGMLGRPVFLDTDSLEGWTTYGLGPRQMKQGSSTIVDYGAAPDTGSPYRTVGDIRAFVAAENNPGTHDPTKDFTGFWKEKCDQAFGLQIMHRGSDGKYSIVFCGPGGCGDPSGSRLTYITGDKRWEVVSEDELIEIGRSGDRERYLRCTRETRPVLEYK